MTDGGRCIEPRILQGVYLQTIWFNALASYNRYSIRLSLGSELIDPILGNHLYFNKTARLALSIEACPHVLGVKASIIFLSRNCSIQYGAPTNSMAEDISSDYCSCPQELSFFLHLANLNSHQSLSFSTHYHPCALLLEIPRDNRHVDRRLWTRHHPNPRQRSCRCDE